MLTFLKRTWAEIALDAVEQNYRCIRERVGQSCRVMAVVKADAYGHGDAFVAKTLQHAGADWFGVSNLDEAIRLRESGIEKPVLILSYTPPEEAKRLSRYGITQTVVSAEHAHRLQRAAEQEQLTLNVHLKLDTGMSRVGFFYHHPETDGAVLDEIDEVCALPNLHVEGIFTHFATADEEDDAATRHQFALFSRAVSELEQRGVTFAIKHCCNSAATLRFPEMHLDMVRPGIVLYGLAPARWMGTLAKLTPAMALKTVVSMVKPIPADTTVSYGGTYTAKTPAVVATVPIGYADGYLRSLSNTARMLVNGRSAPLVGRVCMDQCLLDVTAIPDVKEGTVVTVFGTDGDAVLPIEDVAAWSDTIHYECACLIGKRVPRIFYQQGHMIGKQDYFE